MSGYTLLEMLIVLMIMGFVAGVAAPQLANMYESVQFAYQRDDVLLKISGLGYHAFQRGDEFDLDTYPVAEENKETIPLELPDNWRIKAKSPIKYYANGVCSGGDIVLSYHQRHYPIVLTPPFCKATI